MSKHIPRSSSAKSIEVERHCGLQIFSKVRHIGSRLRLERPISKHKQNQETGNKIDHVAKGGKGQSTLQASASCLSFLDMPLEIRNAIYERVFGSSRTYVIFATREHFQRFILGRFGYFQPHPLCHVNRLIRIEALTAFYRMSNFEISKILQLDEHHYFPNTIHLVSLVKKLAVNPTEFKMLNVKFPSALAQTQPEETCLMTRILDFPALVELTLVFNPMPPSSTENCSTSNVGLIRCLALLRKHFTLKMRFCVPIYIDIQWSNYIFFIATFHSGHGFSVKPAPEEYSQFERWECWLRHALCLDVDVDLFKELEDRLDENLFENEREMCARLFEFSKLSSEDYQRVRAYVEPERLAFFDESWQSNSSR